MPQNRIGTLFALALALLVAASLAGCKRNAAPQAPQGFLLTYQVGAFTNHDNAEALRKTLQDKGFDVSLERAVVNGAPFDRVLVRYRGPLESTYQAGAFTDKAKADELQAALRQKGREVSMDETSIDGKTYFRVYVHVQDGVERLLSGLRELGISEPLFRDVKPL